MNKNISYKAISIVFSVLTICFLMVFYSLAWTEPTASPPGGNVPAPLNTGGIEQTKTGGLRVGGLTVDSHTSLAVESGRVGIGKIDPAEKLDVQGNIVASGSVCANGGANCIITRVLLDLPTVLYKRGNYCPAYTSGNVGSSTGTIIAGTTVGVPAGAKEVLVYGAIDDADSRDLFRVFEYKYPSHTHWKRLTSSPGNAFYPNNNSVWIPFGSEGRIEWRLVTSGGASATPSSPQEYLLEIQGVSY